MEPTTNRNSREKRAILSVTMHDVAKVAGVSAMTVSRAVNTPDRVPLQTLAAVRKAIAQVGYVPNLLAGGLRSKKSRLVAAIIPTVIGPVFSETIQVLTEELRSHGYQLMLGQSGYGDTGEGELIDAIIGRRPDGIILTGVIHTPVTRLKLKASNIPVVEIWDQTDEPLDMVIGFSHIAVADAVCRYLHGHSKKQVAVIGGNDERAKRRSSAFLKTAKTLGMAVPDIYEVEAPTTLGSGRAAIQHLLRHNPRIDAVFCSSDMLALGVLTECKARGLAVPARLGVIGFGDLSFASDLDPTLTTVRIDGSQMGREAARCIVDRAEGKEGVPKSIDIGFSIVQRQSC